MRAAGSLSASVTIEPALAGELPVASIKPHALDC